MNRATGIIGTGRMGGALARGLVKSGFDPSMLAVFDADPASAERTVLETGASAASSIAELARQVDVIVLAVKPQNIDFVLSELSPAGDRLVISIAAGITTSRIEKALSRDTRVVRVMPNTPLQIGKGASAYCLARGASWDDGEFTRQMFERFGIAVEVTEDLMDAVTGLSGSGPAFVYYMIESLVRGAVENGLSDKVALKLAAQTALGAAAMVMETGKSPAELRAEVTSPGGTTIAGLTALDSGNWASITASAVTAAAERSRELGTNP